MTTLDTTKNIAYMHICQVISSANYSIISVSALGCGVANFGSGRGEDTPNKPLKGLFSIVTSDNKFQHVVIIFPYQERFTPRQRRQKRALMTHKYMGSIVAFSTSKIVESNEEQKEMTSGFQQGNVCKC